MTFQELINSKLDSIDGKLDASIDASILDEAGNFSSAAALSKHGKVLRNGRRLLSDRNSTDAEKLLAKMIADCAGLMVMAIAVSGTSSVGSTISKGASLRSI